MDGHQFAKMDLHDTISECRALALKFHGVRMRSEHSANFP